MTNIEELKEDLLSFCKKHQVEINHEDNEDGDSDGLVVIANYNGDPIFKFDYVNPEMGFIGESIEED